MYLLTYLLRKALWVVHQRNIIVPSLRQHLRLLSHKYNDRPTRKMAVDVTAVSQTRRRQGLMQMPWRNVS